MRRFVSILGVVLLGLVAAAGELKFIPLPWFWVGLTVAAVSYAVAVFAPRALQLSIVVVGSIPIAFSMTELVIAYRPDHSKTMVPRLDEPDELLGWRAVRSRVAHATGHWGEQVIYDVAYSIDNAGRRREPPHGADVEGCVFFFADSFAFGEGVNDDETLPYQFGLKTNGRFRVLNYGFYGYGAEHMLAMVERGDLAEDAPCTPAHIVYLALPHHVVRAAGKTDFSARGPRYRLGTEGIPQYVPPHTSGSQPATWDQRVVEQLSKSALYRRLTARGPRTTSAEIDLYFALAKRAIVLFKRRWPSVGVHVVGWDLDHDFAQDRATFHRRLNELGVNVYFLEDILPGYVGDPAKYSVHEFDRHPSAAAHQMVASYLAERLLRPAMTTTRLSAANGRCVRCP